MAHKGHGVSVNAGYRDQRERDEKTHDIVTKLLLGTLFRGYDPQRHGPMELRFRCAVKNAVRNLVEKERNRRLALGLFALRAQMDAIPGYHPHTGNHQGVHAPWSPGEIEYPEGIEGWRRSLSTRRLPAHPGGSCQPSSDGEFGSWESKLTFARSKLLVA